MKKLVTIVLAALMLLCCCAAFAEAPAAFTFRNGLHWGMNPDEVLTVEGKGDYDKFYEASYTCQTYDINDLEFSKFEADITYLFVNNQLVALEIDPFVTVYEEEDVDYLKQALTIVYGEMDPNLPVPENVTAILSERNFEVVCGWQPTADSYVCIVSDGYWFELYYCNMTIDIDGEMQTTAPTPTPEPININGL